MPSMPWFRFYSEALNDRKIARAVRLSGQPKALVMGVWLTLLCLANDSPERGQLMIADDLWLEEDEIIAETGLDPITFGKIVTAFQSLNMVAVSVGYEVLNWGKRQYKSDNSSERVYKHRAKKRAEEQAVKQSVTLQKRYSNVLETDTEEDKEKKRKPPPPLSDSLADQRTDALGEVTGMDLNIRQNRIEVENTAVQLTAYSPDFIRKRYGPGGEWYKFDWRGKREEMPTLKAIRQTIAKQRLGTKAKTQRANGVDDAWNKVYNHMTKTGTREPDKKFGEPTDSVIRRVAGSYLQLCGLDEFQSERQFKDEFNAVEVPA